MSPGLRGAGLALAALVAGCSAPAEEPPRRLVEEHFAANNAAARRGPAEQQDFLDRTQHPDFASRACSLGARTVEFDPAMSTLRPDPHFAPGGSPPRGEVWAVGVEVTVRDAGGITGRQIGSQHVVVLGDRLVGFAPCPSG
ncbi:hypothetical protein [Saccharopolyspora cebuensis]|uniref:Lipoprotein n=1 Tax=Saccharopolyspora cebuensis TaxID=418759 RepID=A0ABV4CTT6_9PSEU